ncbi:hypothetical protein Poli38472_002748 [Pythium oligandrum]|uniref:PDZ GRASP-type domain-containing protein n=1 Tax=Pythium oligandrum TaxID=41045 RepID=A0A8K1CKA6_PYTOL|nr:hypothetical protein Poli38472_002748 [Pythium oligandrum]|eukprot:TMW63807.1 hypothetical protein Poli38472_002748 [Pythium oligandrum]
MGNSSSSPADQAPLTPRRETAEAEYDAYLDEAAAQFLGFRVLGIQEDSPASRVGFVSFFDLIMAANGIRLDVKDSTFMELIAQSEEQPMELEVYNLKAQTTRQLMLTPSRRWAGKGLLGVTIRFDSYEHAEDQLLHVLDVMPDSPADKAGLKAESDYLLGTPERAFRDPEDLSDELLDALDNETSFQCYVYNTESDQVRIVTIKPQESSSGGILGAEVGHGVLHRLPSSCRDTIGSSVGFVSLSDEAKAATDPFLRHEAPKSQDMTEEPFVPEISEEESKTEETQGELSSLSEATEEEAVDEEAATPPPAPIEPAPPSPRPTKLRYAARIDPFFPLSTVEVYVDPSQVR